MGEDTLQNLKREREEREKAYTEIRGIIKGVRLARLSETDENFLKIFEFILEGFKTLADQINTLFEGEIHLARRIETLEKDVKQLKETIDTLMENR